MLAPGSAATASTAPAAASRPGSASPTSTPSGTAATPTSATQPDNQRQATPIDVVAHEFGHAIFQTTPGGAGSGNENGGINESTGDIFGALTEAYANNPQRPAGLHRRRGGQPGPATGRSATCTTRRRLGDPNCYSSSIPNTEVHAAAGPLNHWFYLLSAGLQPGRRPAGQPDLQRLHASPASASRTPARSSWARCSARPRPGPTSSSAGPRWRPRLQLFPGSCTEFNTTKAAWTAVSVPAASGEPASCGTTGNDFALSLNPTSANVQPGQQATATVGTQTTSGSAQSVSSLGDRPALGRDRLLQPGVGDLGRLLHPDDLGPGGRRLRLLHRDRHR